MKTKIFFILLYVLCLVVLAENKQSIDEAKRIIKVPEPVKVVAHPVKDEGLKQQKERIKREAEEAERRRVEEQQRASRGSFDDSEEIIKQMKVQATAYCDYGATASGKITKPWHTVASDWRVLPKGTKFWITEFGKDKIFCVEDKGGAVKGNIIDIYHPNEDWCWDWGRKNVTINIIEWGNNHEKIKED